MGDRFRRKSLDDILAGEPRSGGGQGPPLEPRPAPGPWRPKTLQEILDRRPDTNLRVAASGLAGYAGTGQPTETAPRGTIYKGFVFSNPLVIENLRKLEQAILEQGADSGRHTFRVTGGDRYIDAQGNHRSATDHAIVANSDPNSPHPVENGARAADIAVTGTSREGFERALGQTEFLPANTRFYPNHIHVALPKLRPYYAPR